MLLAAPLAALLMAVTTSPYAAPGYVQVYGQGRVLFRFADQRITESSGLAAGPDGLTFTHNDSGDSARFFAVDRNGRTRSTHVLPGVQARDWEDMARGPDGTLWLGDIGDNESVRDRGILVHRVPEPGAARGTVNTPPPASFRLRYEDGPHDAEALLVHPLTGQLGVVTKTVGRFGGLYLAPLPLQPGVNVLRFAADVPLMLVTGGAVSPLGDRLVLRTYGDAHEWALPSDDLAAAFEVPPTRVPLLASDQGEAVTYSRDGRSLLASAEGVGAPVQLLRRASGPPAPARDVPVEPLASPRDLLSRDLLAPFAAVATLLCTALLALRLGRRRRR